MPGFRVAVKKKKPKAVDERKMAFNSAFHETLTTIYHYDYYYLFTRLSS